MALHNWAWLGQFSLHLRSLLTASSAHLIERRSRAMHKHVVIPNNYPSDYTRRLSQDPGFDCGSSELFRCSTPDRNNRCPVPWRGYGPWESYVQPTPTTHPSSQTWAFGLRPSCALDGTPKKKRRPSLENNRWCPEPPKTREVKTKIKTGLPRLTIQRKRPAFPLGSRFYDQEMCFQDFPQLSSTPKQQHATGTQAV